jgi:hypothetical protein
MTHVLSWVEPREFRPIANNQFRANPLIIMFEMRHGDIFKVRNSIKSFHDKLEDILYRAVVTKFEIKDSEMNQGSE